MERSSNYDSDLEINNAPPLPKKRKLVYTKAPEDKRKWKGITLVNVVVTGSTECSLDLHKLSKNLLNAEYFPKKFAALKLCRTDPFAKALVFRSGKIVCVGATSIERAIESLEWFAERIRSIEGEHITIHEKTIQNMVASTSLKDDKVSVNLQKVFDNCPQNIQFEP
jgi:transcription initiation factor TFIID TATA-box-binding protein